MVSSCSPSLIALLPCLALLIFLDPERISDPAWCVWVSGGICCHRSGGSARCPEQHLAFCLGRLFVRAPCL